MACGVSQRHQPVDSVTAVASPAPAPFTLRYYQPKDATKPLWERWFHCFDLGKQLGPVIKE